MANPIAVKGIRRIVDKLSDEVTRAAKNGLRAFCDIKVEGQFGFDKDGEFGLVGNVVATGPSGVTEVAELGGEIEGSGGSDWNSQGTGMIELHFRVETVPEVSEE